MAKGSLLHIIKVVFSAMIKLSYPCSAAWPPQADQEHAPRYTASGAVYTHIPPHSDTGGFFVASVKQSTNSACIALQHGPHKLTKSMFPDAASDALPLERCIRILPHHSDTGGFFVAVFEKVAKYPQHVRYAADCVATFSPN